MQGLISYRKELGFSKDNRRAPENCRGVQTEAGKPIRVLRWLGDDCGVDQGGSSGDERSEILWEEEQTGLTGKLEVKDEER